MRDKNIYTFSIGPFLFTAATCAVVNFISGSGKLEKHNRILNVVTFWKQMNIVNSTNELTPQVWVFHEG